MQLLSILKRLIVKQEILGNSIQHVLDISKMAD